ncbi:MAG: hypothetical protein K0S33_2301 [Bacteroidetes bacterium]|jgi:hypothetical protein|nr:hypothetical protein [Bacteroidota bacterium]
MKKKTGLYVIVLILVGVTAYTLVKKAKRSTLDSESATFSYNDTASITKIRILEKNGQEAILERKENKIWTVNGKFPAREKNVDLLLYTLKQIHVKYPASEKAMNTVIQSIATIGKRVEFYAGDKKIRVWYIGTTTPDHLGTYMVLGDTESDDKHEQAYVTYIPGFEGFLNTRFFTNYNDWKSNAIIATTPPEIFTVRVEHTGMPDSSFIIEVLGVNKFILTDLNKKAIANPDTFAIKQYLTYCCNLDVDTYLTGKSDTEIDSVKRSQPFTVITITLKNGLVQKMKLFNKKPLTDEVDETLGVKLMKDPNFAYMLFSNDQEFGVVQYLMFGKLIQSRDYFMHPAFVKK